MSSEQLNDVENFVNGIIKKDLPVFCEEMSLEKARELNAMGVFESKYEEKVKVYTIGEGDNIVSREICGGPHVEQTGVLGHFKIIKEESSSSGVRRIKAILE
jgi:alanyl-tRNA synthetase